MSETPRLKDKDLWILSEDPPDPLDEIEAPQILGSPPWWERVTRLVEQIGQDAIVVVTTRRQKFHQRRWVVSICVPMPDGTMECARARDRNQNLAIDRFTKPNRRELTDLVIIPAPSNLSGPIPG